MHVMQRHWNDNSRHLAMHSGTRRWQLIEGADPNES